MWIIIGVLAGFVLAPAATLLIARPPLLDGRESLALPFRCRKCKQAIRPTDAVPVLSFGLCHGRCRSCREPIPRWVPFAELASIGASGLVGWRIGAIAHQPAALPAFVLFALTLVVVVVIDAQIHRIPTKVVYPAAVLSAVLLLAAGAVRGEMDRSVRALSAGLAASAFIWILVFVMPSGMGQGDARLCLVLGQFLGWWGWRQVYLGLTGGFFLGAIGGVLLMLRRRGGLKTQIAFGPYLAAAAFAVALWPDLA